MRQDQWSNTVTLTKPDGTKVLCGVWDTWTGGVPEASETKYKPGGMAPEKSLGGSVSVSNITLGRLLDQEGGDWQLCQELMRGAAGKWDADLARQPLDADGLPFGESLMYSGKLQSVNPGDTDSNSTGAQVWQIVISTHGSIA